MVILLPVLLLVSSGYAFPAWEAIGPEGSGYGLMSIVQSYDDPGTLYSVGGPEHEGNFVLASGNLGDDWALVASPAYSLQPHPGVIAMTPDGVLLFTHYGQSQIARSTDMGMTWSWVSIPGSYPTLVYDISTIPGGTGYAWAAGRGGNGRAWFWDSDDSGLSWGGDDMITTEAEVYRLSVCTSVPLRIFAAGMVYPIKPLLLGSADGGASWAVLTPAAALSDSIGLAVAVCPDNPLIVLFSTRHNLYRSVDGAQTWSVVSSEDWLRDIEFSQTDTDLVFAGGNGATLRSSDAGATWTRETVGSPGDVVRALYPSRTDAGRVFACTSEGFRYSADGGNTWLLDNDGMMLVRTGCMTACSGSSQMLYMFIDGVFSVSDDMGSTWSQRVTPSSMSSISASLAANVCDPDEVVATDNSGRIFRTGDGGLSWTVADSSMDWPAGDVAAHPSLDGFFVACGTGTASGYDRMTIGTSDNGGQSWTFDDYGDSGAKAYAIAFDPVHPDTFYVAGSYFNTQGVIMLRSTDCGASFEEVQTPALDAIRDIAVSPDDPEIILVAAQYGVYRSEDFGESWTRVVICDLPTTVLFDPANPQAAFYYEYLQGACFSGDAGLTWTAWNEGMVTHDFVDALALVPGQYMFASTACGAYRLEMGGEGVGGGTPSPGSRRLSVSPNPVTAGCVIDFEVEFLSRVDFRVFDLSGRVVSHFSFEPGSIGRHSVPWSAESEDGRPLGNGVYLIRMESDRGGETARLTLLR